jgi:hypothetical protein
MQQQPHQTGLTDPTATSSAREDSPHNSDRMDGTINVFEINFKSDIIPFYVFLVVNFTVADWVDVGIRPELGSDL